MQNDELASSFCILKKYIKWTKMANLLDFIVHENPVRQLKG